MKSEKIDLELQRTKVTQIIHECGVAGVKEIHFYEGIWDPAWAIAAQNVSGMKATVTRGWSACTKANSSPAGTYKLNTYTREIISNSTEVVNCEIINEKLCRFRNQIFDKSKGRQRISIDSIQYWATFKSKTEWSTLKHSVTVVKRKHNISIQFVSNSTNEQVLFTTKAKKISTPAFFPVSLEVWRLESPPSFLVYGFQIGKQLMNAAKQENIDRFELMTLRLTDKESKEQQECTMNNIKMAIRKVSLLTTGLCAESIIDPSQKGIFWLYQGNQLKKARCEKLQGRVNYQPNVCHQEIPVKTATRSGFASQITNFYQLNSIKVQCSPKKKRSTGTNFFEMAELGALSSTLTKILVSAIFFKKSNSEGVDVTKIFSRNDLRHLDSRISFAEVGALGILQDQIKTKGLFLFIVYIIGIAIRKLFPIICQRRWIAIPS